MRTRQDIEALEDAILAPYGMRSRDSAGREHKEADHPTRTCYQRDRDRIIHCEAFRRLEYKTQVFVIFEGDYYRTRLTHTLVVAQIARTLGRNLQLNEDLIEAIALAHDLGHSPFGHAGEYALNELMKTEGLPGFNHNIRSFEIVTRFERRYPEFDGLNLSSEVLVGILKHKTTYDKPGVTDHYSKVGPTFEAQVVDVADSLAYLSHDIDDGLTSGCITENDLLESDLWQKAYKKIQSAVKTHDKEMLKYQIVKALIDMQIMDLLHFSNDRLKELNCRSSQEAKEYNFKNPNASPIEFSPSMRVERDFLQSLLNKKLYHHFRVERMTDKAKRIINDLFNVYRNNPSQLPYTVYKRDASYNNQQITEIICNYIAGMTDRFALDEHKKLFNPYQKV